MHRFLGISIDASVSKISLSGASILSYATATDFIEACKVGPEHDLAFLHLYTVAKHIQTNKALPREKGVDDWIRNVTKLPDEADRFQQLGVTEGMLMHMMLACFVESSTCRLLS